MISRKTSCLVLARGLFANDESALINIFYNFSQSLQYHTDKTNLDHAWVPIVLNVAMMLWGHEAMGPWNNPRNGQG